MSDFPRVLLHLLITSGVLNTRAQSIYFGPCRGSQPPRDSRRLDHLHAGSIAHIPCVRALSLAASLAAWSSWDIVHDGWEFRSQAERGLCTQKISRTSLVVHSMHTRADFELARAQFRERCNASCERTTLPFTVDGLKDLCARNPNIPKAYSKCASVGYKPIVGPPNDVPLPAEQPRRKCSSVGERVDFIASKRDGGTITCVDEQQQSRFAARQLLVGNS